jgi:hypothetical protein
MTSPGRKPDYNLAVMNKTTSEKNNNIGVAWKNDNGQISIKLHSFITLTGSTEILLTLFPATDKPPVKYTKPALKVTEANYDDDIPF